MSYTTHKRLTLGELIKTLEDLGSELVTGLDVTVDSYRGYYERNAIGPSGVEYPANQLAGYLKSDIGLMIFGYKGGQYNVSADELVYLAGNGETGPNIIGLERGEDGIYRPVLLAQDYHF